MTRNHDRVTRLTPARTTGVGPYTRRIADVYQTYWKLLETAQDDPTYERDKAYRLLRAFVELHDHAIREKVRIMAEHFHQNVAHRINGRAKAMIVTRSRLHAIRYHRALERYVTQQGYDYDYGALVAFSGTVRDADMEYTEAQLNGFPESQTRTRSRAPRTDCSSSPTSSRPVSSRRSITLRSTPPSV